MKRLYAVYPYLAVNFMPSFSTNDLKLLTKQRIITLEVGRLDLSFLEFLLEVGKLEDWTCQDWNFLMLLNRASG